MPRRKPNKTKDGFIIPPTPTEAARQAAVTAASIARFRKSVEPMWRINLSRQHIINSQPYGPGQVVVPPELGATLAEQESRSVAAQKAMFDPDPPGRILIGRTGRYHTVDASQFDEALGQALAGRIGL